MLRFLPSQTPTNLLTNTTYVVYNSQYWHITTSTLFSFSKYNICVFNYFSKTSGEAPSWPHARLQTHARARHRWHVHTPVHEILTSMQSSSSRCHVCSWRRRSWSSKPYGRSLFLIILLRLFRTMLTDYQSFQVLLDVLIFVFLIKPL